MKPWPMPPERPSANRQLSIPLDAPKLRGLSPTQRDAVIAIRKATRLA